MERSVLWFLWLLSKQNGQRGWRWGGGKGRRGGVAHQRGVTIILSQPPPASLSSSSRSPSLPSPKQRTLPKKKVPEKNNPEGVTQDSLHRPHLFPSSPVLPAPPRASKRMSAVTLLLVHRSNPTWFCTLTVFVSSLLGFPRKNKTAKTTLNGSRVPPPSHRRHRHRLIPVFRGKRQERRVARAWGGVCGCGKGGAALTGGGRRRR